LSLPRTIYKVGELIEATAILENAGTESLYVPKGLGQSSGGIPGFDVELGHNGQPFCHMVADYACSSTEQQKLGT
jgi:hypothetical protein